MASILQNALAARQQGYDQVADFRTDQARMRAGNALAMGRPQEAANALYRGGELDAGEIVLQRDEGRQGRQQARQMAMQEQEAAQAKEAAQMRGMALVRAAQALRAIPAGQRAQALQTRVAPMLGRLGMDTSAFQGLTEEDLSDQGLDLFAGQVQRELEIVKGSDGSFSAVDKGTGEIVNQYQAPRYQSLSPGQSLVEIGGGMGGGAPAGASGGFDAFYDNYLRGVEGGFAADDGNGAPVNFGINQGANPDIDVRNLTPERAKQLMYERYWAPSGADQLPDGLAQVHADTAINMGLGAAQQLLNQSGGDPNRYLELRAQRYRAIAQQDPSKARYLNTWMRRNEQLAQFVGGGMGGAGGGARVIAQGAPKETARPATAEEKAQYGIPADVPAQVKPDGTIAAVDLPKGTSPQERQRADQGRQAQIKKAEGLIATIREAEGLIGRGVFPGSGEAGFRGAVAAQVPGTQAYNLARQLETIKANLGFAELQAMREASPTGGALGQVAVQELVALQATVANLDIGQSEQQLRANLAKVRQHYQAWLNAVQRSGGRGPDRNMGADRQGSSGNRPPLSSFQN